MTFNKKALASVLANHQKWLDGGAGRKANLCGADLRGVDLQGANLIGANLVEANLLGADLRRVNLEDAQVWGANLKKANLGNANLRFANLYKADLTGAVLEWALLQGANLKEAKGLLSPIDFIDKLEKCKEGVIVYKIFGRCPSGQPLYEQPKPGLVMQEPVNHDRASLLVGSGVNVMTKEWVEGEEVMTDWVDIWQCLIRWEWLAGVCVPYSTDGRFRCEKVEFVKLYKVIRQGEVKVIG